MSPERWKKIEELFQAAGAQPVAQRAAFLDRACPDNPELRGEVESLLRTADSTDSFLEGPPLPPRPDRRGTERQDAPTDPILPPGRLIAHYEIQEKLGEGGMAVVYKANDTRLGRSVALKFVKAPFSQRWAREARMVAALNHPHIATLYDVGEHEGVPYLAMEFVNGAPLEGPQPAKVVVEYGIQVADAVAAAHAVKVVHRDLKPANILVNQKGLAKVLDFGLAKLMETSGGGGRPTQSAAIMGTPGYMAPEQLEGAAADARTDIFAFGCVMYEVAGGRRAFPGKSAAESMAATALGKPEPLQGVPKELEGLILRCLRKEPDRRFQSMLEVKTALETLRDALPNGAASRPIVATAGRQLTRSLVGAALLCAAAGLWMLINRIVDRSEKAGAPAEITQLTNEGGLNIDPAISPDGKLLAYASDHGGDGTMDIWVKQIGGDSFRVTRDRANDVEPNFSPDGTKIVFRSTRDGSGLYLMPTVGGTEQRLVDGGRRPQFSPDGSKIVYWTGPDNPFPLRKGMGQMYIFDLATSTARQLREDFAAAVHPVWSPDGKYILFIGLKDAADVAHTYDWWVTPVVGETAVQCHMFTGKGDFDPFAWQGDRVYFSGQLLNWPRTRAGVVTISPRTWRLAGEPRPLTAGTTNEESPSLSRDGQLVFASLTGNPSLYELPVEANVGRVAGPVRRLTSDGSENTARSISGDGKRIAFVSTRTGCEEIWVNDLASGKERQLTFDGQSKCCPLIIRNGERVAWKLNNMEDHRTFATLFAGGPPTQICADCGVPDAWTSDGKYLLFAQRKSGRRFVGLLDVASGAATEYMADPQLGLRVTSISDNGKWIAFAAFTTDCDFAMYVAPFSPLRPPPQSEWIRIPHSAKAHPNPRWSPDGDTLYFSSEQDGNACIWAERLDPATKHPLGEPFAVQHFHSTSLKMVAPSLLEPIALASDKIVLSLQNRLGEIWMLKLKD